MAGAKPFVDAKIRQRNVAVFSKTYSPACKLAKGILDSYGLPKTSLEYIEIEARQDCIQIENYLQIICLTDNREVPQLFINGSYIGGEKEISELHECGRLKELLSKTNE